MSFEIRQGDALALLRAIPDATVQTCVTSPPYFGLRDYGAVGQMGLESTPEAYVVGMVALFAEVRRVLRDDGTLWLNLGDSYAANRSYHVTDSKHVDVGNTKASVVPAGLKPKDLIGVPWRVAFALQADGWYLRSDIIWKKANPMPESVTDRPTKAHEYLFLLAKSERYFYDAKAVEEPSADRESGNLGTNVYAAVDPIKGRTRANLHAIQARPTRNRRTVWTIATEPFAEAHFAVMPQALVEPCILAGSSAKACEECAAPWCRVVETETRPNWDGGKDQKHDGTHYRPNIGGGVGNDRRVRTDRGWAPTCSHTNAGTASSLVLDPFAGSGTVGVVALRHGRRFLGLELNATYAAMARRRIAGPLFAETSGA